jgi:hypothetical protein
MVHPRPGRRHPVHRRENDGPNCHVVAAVSLKELLNRLEEIVAAQ